MSAPIPEPDPDEQFYRDTESIAFPKLDDRQLAMLEPLGKRRILKRGEMVYKAGQRDMGLAVILRGEVEAFEPRDGEELILATAGPRDFVGDVSMLKGTASLASTRGKAEESEILEVPAEQLRQALAELPGVGETLVRAFIMRRRRLERDKEFAGIRVVTQTDSRDGRQLDDFLDKNHIPHRMIDFQCEVSVVAVGPLSTVAGAEKEMVGIGQQDLHAEIFGEIALRESFDGGLRAYRHEDGRLDAAMRSMEQAGARARDGTLGYYFEGNLRQIRL